METTLTISRANQSHISCVRVRGRTNIFCADQGFWSEWTQDCFSGMELEVKVFLYTLYKTRLGQVLRAALGICWRPALEVGCWLSYTFSLLQHSHSCSFASLVHSQASPKISVLLQQHLSLLHGDGWDGGGAAEQEGARGACSLSTGPSWLSCTQISSFEPCRLGRGTGQRLHLCAGDIHPWRRMWPHPVTHILNKQINKYKHLE